MPCSLCNVPDDGEGPFNADGPEIEIDDWLRRAMIRQTLVAVLLIVLGIRQGLLVRACPMPSGKERIEIRRWRAFSCEQVG